MANCLTYIQTTDNGGASKPRDACMRCGKMKEAHESKLKEPVQIFPPDMVADEWLTKKGFKNTQFFELAKTLLTAYIKDHA